MSSEPESQKAGVGKWFFIHVLPPLIAAVAGALITVYAASSNDGMAAGFARLEQDVRKMTGAPPPPSAAVKCDSNTASAAAGTAPAAMSPPVESSGIRASLISVEARNREIFVNFTLTNTTKARVYFTDVRTDATQLPFLSSGGHLEAPFPSNIPFCNSDMSGCLANPNESAVGKLTYLDPGASVAASMKYGANQELPTGETLSFGLALLARFVDATTSGADPGPPQQVRFNFPNAVITKKG
jgi:hypothetical protein